MPRSYSLFANEAAYRKHFARYASAGAWVQISDPDLPWPVTARVGVKDDHRLVCTGLLIGDPEGEVPITVKRLRDVPLAQFLEDVSQPSSFVAAQVRRLVDVAGDAVISTGSGSRGLPKSHYAEVLAQYRKALEARPSAPFKYLQDNKLLHASDSTMRRWVREAKKLERKGELHEIEEG